MAFIPVKGVPTKANKLFDPRNEVLKEIFGDEPDAFPPGEFGEEAWLDVLVDIGLRNKLDRDTILQCAKKVCIVLYQHVCSLHPYICSISYIARTYRNFYRSQDHQGLHPHPWFVFFFNLQVVSYG